MFVQFHKRKNGQRTPSYRKNPSSAINITMKLLIVIDMQNDFIDGALGTKEAVAIVPNVIEQFILGMMNVEDSDTMAFIIHKPGGNADQSAFVKEIKEVFNEVKYKLEVFENIDLWRKAY